jgi:hypothetical protein
MTWKIGRQPPRLAVGQGVSRGLNGGRRDRNKVRHWALLALAVSCLLAEPCVEVAEAWSLGRLLSLLPDGRRDDGTTLTGFHDAVRFQGEGSQ